MAADLPRILVVPGRSWLADAVRAGGAEPVTEGAADAVVWTDPKDAAGLRRLLDEQPGIDWVQLPWAGIEPYADVLDHDRRWTCGKGVYADPVAEQALMFALAGLRGMATYAHATTWEGPTGRNLIGARSSSSAAVASPSPWSGLLAPFRCEVVVVRRARPRRSRARRAPSASTQLDEELPGRRPRRPGRGPHTRDRRSLRRGAGSDCCPAHAWMVNVARGRHVVTDDLVRVLQDGAIGGAGLDVVDPEPLPDGHPLWSLPNCFLTPARREHPGDGGPAAVGAGPGERAALRRRRGAPRARRRRRRLLTAGASRG